jgi:hypothetical protein
MGVYVECYFPNVHGTQVDAIAAALNAALSPGEATAWQWDGLPTPDLIADGTCELRGPAGLLWISSGILRTRGNVRWRWLLQNREALSETLEHFRSLGRKVLAHSMLIVPDWAMKVLLDPPDVTFEVVPEWGACQSLDAISPAVVAEAEHASPQVWFHETLPSVALWTGGGEPSASNTRARKSKRW